MSVTRILVFAKAPLPGRVKTRLIARLGADGAARLAARMLAGTIDEARAAGTGPVTLVADPDPGDSVWTGFRPEGIEAMAQGEGDLGARMARAARLFLSRGERVMLVSADCPSLDRNRLRAAAAALARHDAVIHPAGDGGYVLLGLARFDPSLFDHIAWSTPAVLPETLGRLSRLGWSVRRLETLRDVDRPADMDAVRHLL